MYAAGGCWYVYLCYGVHEMLNLVVGPRDVGKTALLHEIAHRLNAGDAAAGRGAIARPVKWAAKA